MWRVARFAVRCGPGNTTDMTTLVPIVKRMRERFRLREITVVADRGMVSQKTLEALEGSDPPVGLHYWGADASPEGS
jgi:transposase